MTYPRLLTFIERTGRRPRYIGNLIGFLDAFKAIRHGNTSD
jgi:hypothetical protein